MKIQRIDEAPFGALITDLDCSQVDEAQAHELRNQLHRHQVLVVPQQQHLEPWQEVAFYRAIESTGSSVWRDQCNNPWEVFKVEQGNTAGTWQIPDEPGVLVLGKGEIDHHGLQVTLGGERSAYGDDQGSQVLGGGALQWHIDGTFYGHAPCRYTQMRCVEAPSSSGHWLSYGESTQQRLWCPAGSTAFASGRIAFDLLSRSMKNDCFDTQVHYASHPFQSHYRLGNSNNGLRVVDPRAETLYASGTDFPGAAIDDPLAQVYPLVWTCRDTGLQALMPQPRCLHAIEVRSRFLGVVESRFQVETWMRPAIDPQHVYDHDWQPGDLVIWNNHSVWHSATGKLSRDDRRIMHLTAFNGAEIPSCIRQ